MKKEHHYQTQVQWTGNTGTGTSGYKDYDRSHTVSIYGKHEIFCSSDPSFLGDSSKYNPEELFVSTISSCHMLWYLHFCATAGIVVVSYTDNATGVMETESNGSGHFTEITLYPLVIVTEEHMVERALELHKKAHDFCFIANSVNFEVNHKPKCTV
ncbi:MAG: OsmC family protein [Maribacter sp.]